MGLLDSVLLGNVLGSEKLAGKVPSSSPHHESFIKAFILSQKKQSQGLEWWLSSQKPVLFLKKNQIWFPASMLGSSHLTVTPTPGDSSDTEGLSVSLCVFLCLSFCLSFSHTPHTHTHTHILHTHLKEIFVKMLPIYIF